MQIRWSSKRGKHRPYLALSDVPVEIDWRATLLAAAIAVGRSVRRAWTVSDQVDSDVDFVLKTSETQVVRSPSTLRARGLRRKKLMLCCFEIHG